MMTFPVTSMTFAPTGGILKDAALDEPFLKGAKAAGLLQLKGHRSVGGMRASIYNAMPEEGIAALIKYMQDFQSKQG